MVSITTCFVGTDWEPNCASTRTFEGFGQISSVVKFENQICWPLKCVRLEFVLGQELDFNLQETRYSSSWVARYYQMVFYGLILRILSDLQVHSLNLSYLAFLRSPPYSGQTDGFSPNWSYLAMACHFGLPFPFRCKCCRFLNLHPCIRLASFKLPDQLHSDFLVKWGELNSNFL